MIVLLRNFFAHAKRNTHNRFVAIKLLPSVRKEQSCKKSAVMHTLNRCKLKATSFAQAMPLSKLHSDKLGGM